eukprot:CAMPEP_0197073814 /NCGR_PEP_ID=MMETSP1384-20130603/210796_1 /TAXON_ID=29189 /ORGANISM="Ammonia sp." /LENGTH=439 /DNA_ID=CAMNT_0042512655 /DNA_START=52 /DNA_END=1371 /DNA_ORIENTATION=+
MGNTGNYGNNTGSVDIELDFEIDPNRGQDELRSFGYYFNAKGECRNTESNERVGRFASQQKYEEFGAALERYIFFLLRDQYKMSEKFINSTDHDNDDDDQDQSNEADDVAMKQAKQTQKTKKTRPSRSQISEDKIAKSRIYLSPQYGDKQTLLLLIPGSGAVRAGQWARSICINDGLAAGTMYPFIAEAYKRDWGVVLFDPNGRTDSGRVFSDDHVMYVYNRWIEAPYLSQADCKIENVLIVCHSAGGMATTRLLNDKTKHLLPRIRGVAGTDTFFGRAQTKQVQRVYERHIVNYVTSREELGTVLSNTVPKRLSAGHSAHEYTSASAFAQIFSYFDAMLNVHRQQSVKSKDAAMSKADEAVENDKNEKESKQQECEDEQKEQEKEIVKATETESADKPKEAQAVQADAAEENENEKAEEATVESTQMKSSESMDVDNQ